jgi:DNA-directed RNA polymerase subunit M/transcription elongation factor TFIIS
MPTLSTVLLSIKGDIKKANLTLSDDNTLSLETIQKYFKKKEQAERVCYYEYDNKIIFIFGYKKGKKGTENKIELPAPYDSLVLFGDALVIVSLNNKWDNPIPFTVDQWNTFYTNLQNIEKEDEDEDEDDEADEDEDVVSEAGTEKSVKDDFEDENGLDLIEESDSDEQEIEPVVRKRKTNNTIKVDINLAKDEITIDSKPETNNLRIICIDTFYNFLKDKFTKEKVEELEKAIFETTFNNSNKYFIPKNWKSTQFCELYRQIVRTVLSNIHPDSPVKNPRLLNRVLDGEFELSSIPSMTAYEMYPEKWFALKDKLLQREQKILEGNKSRATDQFKCRRCNKRECTYYEMQTRSADEPMTIFITCLNCGKEWRQGG